MVRRPAKDLFELPDRGVRVAHLVQGRAEHVTDRGIVRIELERAPEMRRRGREIRRLHRLEAAVLVGHRAFQQPGVFLHQRVDESRLATPAQPQLRVSLLQVTEAAVRHRERVMQAGRLGLDRQGPPEMLRRPGGIASCQNRPAQSPEGSSRLRLQGNGLGEHPLGGVGSIFIEVGSAETHQRWEIGWTQLQHTLERLRGFRPFAARQVQLPQVVGPAGIGSTPGSARCAGTLRRAPGTQPPSAARRHHRTRGPTLRPEPGARWPARGRPDGFVSAPARVPAVVTGRGASPVVVAERSPLSLGALAGDLRRRACFPAVGCR